MGFYCSKRNTTSRKCVDEVAPRLWWGLAKREQEDISSVSKSCDSLVVRSLVDSFDVLAFVMVLH